jgi:hypothetical protein
LFEGIRDRISVGFSFEHTVHIWLDRSIEHTMHISIERSIDWYRSLETWSCYRRSVCTRGYTACNLHANCSISERCCSTRNSWAITI